MAVLKVLRTRQAAERLVAGEAWVGEGHVFTRGLGGPIFPDTVSQLMPRLIEAYNASIGTKVKPLPRARLHDLRHVYATTLLLAGVPVRVVAERLGHADPLITLRVYAHVIRRSAAGVADIFAHEVDTDEARDDPRRGRSASRRAGAALAKALATRPTGTRKPQAGESLAWGFVVRARRDSNP